MAGGRLWAPCDAGCFLLCTRKLWEEHATVPAGLLGLLPASPYPPAPASCDSTPARPVPCAGRRRFRVTRLPRFMVLHVRRFLKNQFFVEKNPTIVNFPVKNLELAGCIPVPKGAPCAGLARTSRGGGAQGGAAWGPAGRWHCVRLRLPPLLLASPLHVRPAAAAGPDSQPAPSKYDLVANVVHEGKAGAGLYRVHIHRKVGAARLLPALRPAPRRSPFGPAHSAACPTCGRGAQPLPLLLACPLLSLLLQVEDVWYEVQDLRVTEVLPQMVALSETYLQVYELKEQ